MPSLRPVPHAYPLPGNLNVQLVQCSGDAMTWRCGGPTYAGATSVVLSLIGFLGWVFVVPPLARSYVTGDAATRAAADAA